MNSILITNLIQYLEVQLSQYILNEIHLKTNSLVRNPDNETDIEDLRRVNEQIMCFHMLNLQVYTVYAANLSMNPVTLLGYLDNFVSINRQ